VGYSLYELAKIVNGRVEGDDTLTINAINDIDAAKKDEISFISNSKFIDKLRSTKAGSVLVKEKDLSECPCTSIVVDDPYAAYAKVATLFHPLHEVRSGIHPSAQVNPDSRIHETCWIGENCVIGKNVTIGEHTFISPGCIVEENVVLGDSCTLFSNVTIMHGCNIGDRVLIHAGVVIGCDGFGQAPEGDKWLKIPQLGRVVLGSDVEIGANCTIDRGSLNDTIIENGVKLDNLVHIAHNVTVGQNTVIAAQTGIAGSTTIGEHCIFGGQVAVSGHITLSDNVTLTGRSVAYQAIRDPGVYSSGSPLETNREWHRNFARMKQLDEMAKKIKTLETQLSKLKGD
jgi:UDP-3-O-[3-hydroxymyristoyl] glucosamine N-acyltransferase